MGKNYGPKLGRLAREYQSEALPLSALTLTVKTRLPLADYAKKHDVGFPLLKGLRNEIADRLGVKRTPEVVVLDADRVVRYTAESTINTRWGHA